MGTWQEKKKSLDQGSDQRDDSGQDTAHRVAGSSRLGGGGGGGRRAGAGATAGGGRTRDRSAGGWGTTAVDTVGSVVRVHVGVVVRGCQVTPGALHRG